jgi:hypothetical protein
MEQWEGKPKEPGPERIYCMSMVKNYITLLYCYLQFRVAKYFKGNQRRESDSQRV